MQIDVLTKNDLLQLKSELLEEIKKLITPQTNEPTYYKSNEVKRMLKCSDSTLQYFRQSGKLQAKKVRGTYYYPQETINNFLLPTS
jgi:Helix-turn-helix domain